jgi:hypothetical protein
MGVTIYVKYHSQFSYLPAPSLSHPLLLRTLGLWHHSPCTLRWNDTSKKTPNYMFSIKKTYPTITFQPQPHKSSIFRVAIHLFSLGIKHLINSLNAKLYLTIFKYSTHTRSKRTPSWLKNQSVNDLQGIIFFLRTTTHT